MTLHSPLITRQQLHCWLFFLYYYQYNLFSHYKRLTIIPSSGSCYNEPCAIMIVSPCSNRVKRPSKPRGSDFHQDQLSPSWPSLILLYNCWKGVGGFFLPHWRKPVRGGQPVPVGSLSVSLLCLHPASLQLTLQVGNHKRVSSPEQHLLCKAPPYSLHALCQPFLNH